ncbi:MAG: methionine aminotransferase [Myxococcota bacterium]
MKPFPGKLDSKLPETGTSIFAVMTQMATEHGAINLAQGFPDFQVAPELIELVHGHMRAGRNQYAPMPGVKALREAIAEKTESLYGATYHPENEITVTAGATQALFAAISTFIGRGDEAIIFEPAYDSYVPAVRMHGGVPLTVRLKPPTFSIDWSSVRARVTDRTRMIIINSPHNPTGVVLDEKDMKELEALVGGTDIIVLSDEVYEHIIFDGRKHESVCRYPLLAERSLVTCSFGKTFHATGWKTGYCLAPAELTRELRKTHQFMVFCSNAPVQHAIADYLADPSRYQALPDFFQAKRDLFIEALRGSRFRITPSAGTYFQLVDYSRISDEPEMDFAKRLTVEKKVASVPVSSFHDQPVDAHLLRLCFAKSEETLLRAAEVLAAL